MKIKCISEEKCIKGLITKGSEYIILATNNIGDVLVEQDDKGSKRWYKKEYFNNFNSCDLPCKKARI